MKMMKKIFTLFAAVVYCLSFSRSAFSQCNYSSGANGLATAMSAPIIIDGSMNDWLTYLNDPDNNSYDNTNSIDLDAPISDAGRDLTRFTFTEDANNLYIYLQRAGSTNNSVDIIYYADINNNGVMESREPVIHMNWGGSNGNVTVSIYDYVPSLLGTLNSITLNLDGLPLMGTLSYRGSAGSAVGEGSADGRSVEVKIPFSNITQLNSGGAIINQLTFGQDFKFHVSTINGNVSSIPNSNSINDNFGGCLKAPIANTTLPIKLLNFDAKYNEPNVVLNWSILMEKNFSHFVIENSTDGSTFSDAGTVFAFGNTKEQKNYEYTDNVGSISARVIYYRLRQVDIDGKFEYSATRIIRIGKQAENAITILTYPNPATSELRVTIPGNWQGKKVIYEIVNANGQVSRKSQVGNSNQTETLSVSTLSPGIYMVKASCGDQSAQQKIVKQ
jgi:hypothetical protein